MSFIVKNASFLLKRMTTNSGLISNKLMSIRNKSMPLRSISGVFSNRHYIQSANNCPLIVSKRLASNTSPKSDLELSEFLTSEIELEKKNQKNALPSLPGWTTETDGSNVIFKKKYGSEELTVKANVNHSVNSDEDVADEVEADQEPTSAEMVAKPDFAIEIKRGNTILGINCSFVGNEDIKGRVPEEEYEQYEDEFQINEIAIYEEKFAENSYAVSGDVMDGNMYDLIMDYLQERGIDQDFAKGLIEYTTVYEHRQYVGLLEKLKSFVQK